MKITGTATSMSFTMYILAFAYISTLFTRCTDVCIYIYLYALQMAHYYFCVAACYWLSYKAISYWLFNMAIVFNDYLTGVQIYKTKDLFGILFITVQPPPYIVK